MSTESDALDLTYWHESLPDKGTFRTDEQVAASLQWWRKDIAAFSHIDIKYGRYKGTGPIGDASRVRKARNYVNRQTDNPQSPFFGYSFGTKRNGSGQKWMMLIVRSHETPSARGLQDATQEQVSRTIQMAAHVANEVAVQITRLSELETQYMAAGRIPQAMFCHDAAHELRVLGRIEMDTLRSGQELGLLTSAGVVL